MTTKRTNPRKDFTQVAFSVVQQATGETAAPAPSKKQESGRKGGGDPKVRAPASRKKAVAQE
jgi:hypothetical protein